MTQFEHEMNEVFGGDRDDVGIIVQGGLYNTLIRTLERLNLADTYGECEIPIYVLNVAYPIVDEEVLSFCDGKDAVLLVEEGQPNYIEQNLNTVLRQGDASTVLVGKDVFPMAGEYTAAIMRQGIVDFRPRDGSVVVALDNDDAGSDDD